MTFVSRKITAVGLGLLMIMGVAAIPAVAKAEGKIVVVDMMQAMTECKEGKRAQAELKRQAEKRQNEMKDLGDEINKLRSYLLDAQDMMKSDVKIQKEYELKKKMKQFNDLRDDVRQELASAERRLVEPLQRKMLELVQAIGVKENYELIMDKRSGVVYVPASRDITQEVISAYDAKYK